MDTDFPVTGREGEVARAAVKGTGRMLKGMFYDPIANLAELEKWQAYNGGEYGTLYMDPQGNMHTEADYQKEFAKRTFAVAMMGMGLNSAPGLAVKSGPGVVLGANRVGLPVASQEAMAAKAAAATEQRLAQQAAAEQVTNRALNQTPAGQQVVQQQARNWAQEQAAKTAGQRAASTEAQKVAAQQAAERLAAQNQSAQSWVNQQVDKYALRTPKASVTPELAPPVAPTSQAVKATPIRGAVQPASSAPYTQADAENWVAQMTRKPVDTNPVPSGFTQRTPAVQGAATENPLPQMSSAEFRNVQYIPTAEDIAAEQAIRAAGEGGPAAAQAAEAATPLWKKALGALGLSGLAAGTAGYLSADKNKTLANTGAKKLADARIGQNSSIPNQSPVIQSETATQQPIELPAINIKAKGKSAFKGKGGAVAAGAGAGAGAKAAGAAGAAAPATAAMPTPTATPNIPMDASGRPNFNYYSEMLNSADANNAYYRDFVNLREQARMAAIEAGNRGESYRFVPIRDVKSNRVYFVNANGNDIALDMNDKQDRERFNKIVEQSGVDPIKMSEWMSRSSRPLMRHMMPGGGYQEAAPDFNFNRQRAQESVDTQGNKLQYYSDVNRAPVPSQQPGQQAVKLTTTPAAEMPTPTAQVPTPATQTPEQPKPTGSIFDWANVSPDQAYQLAQAQIIAKRKQAGMTPAQQRQIDANKGRVRW